MSIPQSIKDTFYKGLLNPNRRCIDLDHREINDRDCISIANALAGNPHLQFLNLRGNEIDDEGLQLILAAAISSRLEKLDVSENPFAEVGVRAIQKLQPFKPNLDIVVEEKKWALANPKRATSAGSIGGFFRALIQGSPSAISR